MVGQTGPVALGKLMDLWVEDMYDGIRCQLHKVAGQVVLFSRELKDITASFDGVAAAARRMCSDVILDGEIVAVRGDEIGPFAELERRAGRQERDLFVGDEIPVRLVVFDLLWLNGDSLLDAPLRERRAALDSLQPLPAELIPARITRVASVEEIAAAFDASRSRGNQGLLIKNPESAYTPGQRGRAWVKLKKTLATARGLVPRPA